MAVELHGLRFTPFEVTHSIPTLGFLVEERRGASLIWSSDTGPTVELWEIANRTEALRAIFLETSFHNDLQELADLSLHLTPRTLAEEVRKLDRRVPILLHHVKPPSRKQLLEEISALHNPDLAPLEQGKVYDL
jgi:ribonuclease BN (tRNA processing enzyme)